MIRVFIGCAPDGADAESQAVLEHSIRSRCTGEVDITWMIATRRNGSLWSGWDMSRWATPFSGFRWAVPVACGYRGRAIYMDSDLVVLGDLAELFELHLKPGQVAAARNPFRFCVTLWDCAAAKGHILPLVDLQRADGHATQAKYFATHPGLVQNFGSTWNYLDTEDRGPFGKVVHYTDLSTQPQLNHALARLARDRKAHWYDGPRRPHPRPEIVELFEAEYAAARQAGFHVEQYLPAETYGQLSKRIMAGYRGLRA